MKNDRYKLFVLLFAGMAFAALSCAAEGESRPQDSDAPGTDSSADSGATDTSNGAGDDTAQTDSVADDTEEPADCDPEETWCEGDWVMRCREDGTFAEKAEDCAASSLLCAGGTCADVTRACADAANDKSYQGCEYWATTFINLIGSTAQQLDDYSFGLAVANENDEEVAVRITDGKDVVHSDIVPAGDMIVVENLPWKKLLVVPGNRNKNTFASRQVKNGAFRITSSLPVSVYQFNPLQYTAGPENFSFSNDASLLLPAHALRSEYMVLSRPTMQMKRPEQRPQYQMESWPGFVGIVGTGDEPVELEVRASAYTLASDLQSSELIVPLSPGQKASFRLEPHDVLQLLSAGGVACDNSADCTALGGTEELLCCDTPSKFDLTGTRVTVKSGPAPAVFAGNSLSFVPYDTRASDHLEHQMFPSQTWGKELYCAHHVTQRPEEPSVWKILSGQDGNEVVFYPESAHEPVTLNAGEFVELENFGDFRVEGTGPLMAAQFMVGQRFTDPPPDNGDPSMTLVVPVEQYRSRYTFFAPESFVYNYVTVVHEKGRLPTLDGTVISGDTVELDDVYARTNLEIAGGIHSIDSNRPFGITVYGVGSYTSYMYPGGLDLKTVVVVK